MEIDRYRDAWASTARSAPNAPTSSGASHQPATARAVPSPAASHSPSTPADTAPRSSPAPRSRATVGVVAYARNTMRPTAVCRIDDATPSPASCAAPRWPTIAVSASRNSGSATSAPSAGTASRTIARSSREGAAPADAPAWVSPVTSTRRACLPPRPAGGADDQPHVSRGHGSRRHCRRRAPHAVPGTGETIVAGRVAPSVAARVGKAPLGGYVALARYACGRVLGMWGGSGMAVRQPRDRAVGHGLVGASPLGAESAPVETVPDPDREPDSDREPLRAGTAKARDRLDDAAVLWTLADRVLAGEDAARAEVARLFQMARAALARRGLETMDVERLKDTSTDKLPLLALRRAGYRSVADLLDERPEDVDRHPGVGMTSAKRAIAAARALDEAAQERLGLRIELDPRDGRATDLLRWLRRAVTLADTLDDVRTPAGGLADGLPALLTAAAPARGRVRLFLTGPRRRERAREALAQVGQVLDDAGSGGIIGALAAADRLLGTAPDDTGVWGDFERRAVRYYGLLGEIVGIRDTVDAGAGQLPADIAARVREQRLDGAFRTVSLRGYQAFGAKFALAQRRVILGDEMGLGKTIQAI